MTLDSDVSIYLILCIRLLLSLHTLLLHCLVLDFSMFLVTVTIDHCPLPYCRSLTPLSNRHVGLPSLLDYSLVLPFPVDISMHPLLVPPLDENNKTT